LDTDVAKSFNGVSTTDAWSKVTTHSPVHKLYTSTTNSSTETVVCSNLIEKEIPSLSASIHKKTQ
jgi:hypothetical protein